MSPTFAPTQPFPPLSAQGAIGTIADTTRRLRLGANGRILFGRLNVRLGGEIFIQWPMSLQES